MRVQEPPCAPAGAALYSPLLEAAIRLSAQAHHGQFRRRDTEPAECCGASYPLPGDCIPYVTHLMGTACILARLGARDEVVAAALLHDYLEDVPDPEGRDTIREVAGAEVLDLVLAVTENKRAEFDATLTWEVRKREQIDAIAGMEPEAVLIKAADLLHNLVSLLTDLRSADNSALVWQRFHAEPVRELWYFTSVRDAVHARLGDHPLAAELDQVVEQVRRAAPPSPAAAASSC